MAFKCRNRNLVLAKLSDIAAVGGLLGADLPPLARLKYSLISSASSCLYEEKKPLINLFAFGDCCEYWQKVQIVDQSAPNAIFQLLLWAPAGSPNV